MREAFRRDLLRVGVVTLVALGLAFLSVWDPGHVRLMALGKWLHSRQRPLITLNAAAPGGAMGGTTAPVPIEIDDGVRREIEEIRTLVRNGDVAAARMRVKQRLSAAPADAHPSLQVEAAALALLVRSPEDADVAPPELERIAQIETPSTWSQPWETLVSAGLGQIDHPERTYAVAQLAGLLATTGAAAYWREAIPRVTELLDGRDAGVVVDVLDAWTLLGTTTVGSVHLVDRGMVRRDLLSAVSQALLDRPHHVEIVEGLVALAADTRRTQRERVLAAMVVTEMADIPIGLSERVPSRGEPLVVDPEHVVAAWRQLSGLPSEEAFRARLVIASKGGANGWWWNRHVGPTPRGTYSAELPAVRNTISGVMTPGEMLTSLLPDPTKTTPPDLIRAMELDDTMRGPIHQLLLLREVVPATEAPRLAANTHLSGIVIAWRRALGVQDTIWTLRIARLERTLSGLRLLDETRLLIVDGDRRELQWEQAFEDDLTREPAWRVPGTIPVGERAGHLLEQLSVRLRVIDEGPLLELERFDLNVRRRTGWTRGMGGSRVPAPGWLPTAYSPAIEDASVANRRTYLLMVEPGNTRSTEWSLEDWRTRLAGAMPRLTRIPTDGRPQLLQRQGLQDCARALALLRPEVDYDALVAANETYDSFGGRAHAMWRARLLEGAEDVFWRDAAGVLQIDRDLRGVAPRVVAELAVQAPTAEARGAIAREIAIHPRITAMLAREIVALADEEPDRVDPALLGAAERALAVQRESDANSSRWGGALLLTFLSLVLVVVAYARRERPSGGRVAATLLLLLSLISVQVDTFAFGMNVLPAWIGWSTAAAAVWLIGRGYADHQARWAWSAFLIAALTDVVAPWLGWVVALLSAVAGVVGCLASASLAPALLDGLVAARAAESPRRVTRGPGVRVIVLAIIGVLIAAGVVVSAFRGGTVGRATAVALLVMPVVIGICSFVLWRVDLARDRFARPIPLLMALSLLCGGLFLAAPQVVGELAGAGRGGTQPDPLDTFAITCILCALIYMWLRTLDAARVRVAADARPHETAWPPDGEES